MTEEKDKTENSSENSWVQIPPAPLPDRLRSEACFNLPGPICQNLILKQMRSVTFSLTQGAVQGPCVTKGVTRLRLRTSLSATISLTIDNRNANRHQYP